MQSVDAIIDVSPKCILYKHLTGSWSLQVYLRKPGIPETYRKCITKLRLSAHKLAIESGRYSRTMRSDRLCTVCDLHDIEDEFHFVLVCPKYKDIRATFIPSIYFRQPNMYKFVQFINTTSQKKLSNLGKYLFMANKKRDSLISNHDIV